MMRPAPKKPLDVLQRVIPKNPKYVAVKPVVDTGASVMKVEQITTREFLKRRDEKYGRVKASQLYGLLIEYSDGGGGEIAEGDETGGDEEGTGTSTAVRRPAGLAGEPCEFVATPADKPYLIVDVREREEYDVCHITESICVPVRVLSRDTVPPEIFRYRNRADSMIILYDSEERQATAMATKMFERGCDNVFIISGGLKSVGNKFPELLDGTLPAELVQKEGTGGSTGGSVRGDGRSVTSSAGSVSARTSTRVHSSMSGGSKWK